jgi:hypothetical protein
VLANPLIYIDAGGLQARAMGRAVLPGFGSQDSCNCTRPDIGHSNDDWKLLDDAVGRGRPRLSDLFPNWLQSDQKDAGNDPKAPGMPTPGDGFEPGKDGGAWVPNPNGSGYGWRDKRGRVWCPTGPRPDKAHGGPHWDVQFPNGDHTNVYPGGRNRGRPLK